jgi:hypothetical protein
VQSNSESGSWARPVGVTVAGVDGSMAAKCDAAAIASGVPHTCGKARTWNADVRVAMRQALATSSAVGHVRLHDVDRRAD